MSFLEACIQDSLPVWRACLDTEFLRGIADGSMAVSRLRARRLKNSFFAMLHSHVPGSLRP